MTEIRFCFRGVEAALGRLADFVTRRYRPILAVMGTAAIVLIALVPTVELNDEWVKYFDEGTEFRRDTEFAIDNLTGVYQIEPPLTPTPLRSRPAQGERG